MMDSFNPLTPGAFCKKRVFLDILAVFRLHFGQISFNPVESAFATPQPARACAEIKIGRESDLGP